MMQKQNWLTEAKRINPNMNNTQLSRIYDANFAVQAPVPTAQPTQAPIQPAQATQPPISPAGITAQAAPTAQPITPTAQAPTQPAQIPVQPTQATTPVSPYKFDPNEYVNALMQGQTVEDKRKDEWIQEAQRLNPNTSQNQLSEIYNANIKSPEEQEPSVENQLQGLSQYYKNIAAQRKLRFDKNPDEEHGFNTGDKMSILGSLVTGGKIGLEELYARVKQLAMEGGEATGFTEPGAAKKFTDEFNRQEAKDKLFQEAMRSNPTIAGVSRFAGSTLPLMLLPQVKGAEAIGNALERIGVTRGAEELVSKVAPWINKAITGATYGELEYDPTLHHGLSQAMMGGLANIALPFGGKLIKSLERPLADAITEVGQKYGIHLPVYPYLEKLARYIPFAGVSNVIRERGQQIQTAGKRMGRSFLGEGKDDDYGSILHGEVKREYFNNKQKENVLHTSIGKLAEKAGGRVNLDNFRRIADEEFYKEAFMPENMRDDALLHKVGEYSKNENTTYGIVDAMRKRIGGELQKMEKGVRFGTVRGEEKGIQDRLYGALKQDMKDYADSKGGKIKELHDKADQLYMDKIKPFISGKYAKFLDKTYDTDQFIGEFLKPDMKNRATTLLDFLPEGKEKGLTAARAAIIHQALRAADIHGVGFNSQKFIQEAMRLRDVNKIIFTKEQNDSLKGYLKLINLTKKLSPASLDPAALKGVSVHGLLRDSAIAGAGAFYEPHLILPLLLSGNVAARILTSSAGRKMLVKISKLAEKASSKQLNPYLSKLMSIMTSSVSAQAGGAL